MRNRLQEIKERWAEMFFDGVLRFLRWLEADDELPL